MVVKTFELAPTLEADGYKLKIRNWLSNEYDVWKNDNIIGAIKVCLLCVKTIINQETIYFPYDLNITVIDGSTSDMPIDFFKKIIMATVTVS